MQCEHQCPVESSFELLTPHKSQGILHQVHGFYIKYFWKLSEQHNERVINVIEVGIEGNPKLSRQFYWKLRIKRDVLSGQFYAFISVFLHTIFYVLLRVRWLSPVARIKCLFGSCFVAFGVNRTNGMYYVFCRQIISFGNTNFTSFALCESNACEKRNEKRKKSICKLVVNSIVNCHYNVYGKCTSWMTCEKARISFIPRLSFKISSYRSGPARWNIRFDIVFFSVNVSSVVFVMASDSINEMSPSLLE